MRIPLSEKTILKWNKELVELHKRVITTYLVGEGVSYATRAKIFRLYDLYINERNIRSYFFTPTNFLIRGLVLNTLDKYSTLSHKDENKKRKRKSNKG